MPESMTDKPQYKDWREGSSCLKLSHVFFDSKGCFREYGVSQKSAVSQVHTYGAVVVTSIDEIKQCLNATNERLWCKSEGAVHSMLQLLSKKRGKGGAECRGWIPIQCNRRLHRHLD
jgi:hypothetical protein